VTILFQNNHLSKCVRAPVVGHDSSIMTHHDSSIMTHHDSSIMTHHESSIITHDPDDEISAYLRGRRDLAESNQERTTNRQNSNHQNSEPKVRLLTSINTHSP
jgi:hypothetical protein